MLFIKGIKLDLVGVRCGWWWVVGCGGLWGGTVGLGFVL